MRKALILFISLLVFAQLSEAAEVRFATQKLAQLAQEGQLEIPDYCGHSFVHLQVHHGTGSYPVVVAYRDSIVSHIGLDLFGNKSHEENGLICDFVERYLLEMMLFSQSAERKRVMKRDGVYICGDIREVLLLRQTDLAYSISREGDGAWVFQITKGGGSVPHFTMEFPCNMELISGKNKIELEFSFMDLLTQLEPYHRKVLRPGNLKRVGENLYIVEKGFYQNQSIQNSAFYKKTHFSYHPVCTSSLPAESVMTLLTMGAGKERFTIRIVQHRYGYTTAETSVPLSHLLALCQEAGCIPYVGIESIENGTIKASLFMVNQAFGYCHTFRVVIPVELLDQEEGVFLADAYTFTPIDNMKS